MTDFILRVHSSEVRIGYVPLPDEPLIEKFLQQEGLPPLSEVVPKDRSTDPFLMATELTERYARKSVCIFVPGRMFDLKGNRKGRGGGWYDRFLSLVPLGWVRIGVAESSQVVPQLLSEPWDEPVDYVLVYDGSHWSVTKTNSRPQIGA